MAVNPILKLIRAKKFGVLIRDAREKSGRGLDECAAALGIPPEELSAIEQGERPATLPELELLAYYLEIPLEHFWGSTVYNPPAVEKGIDAEAIKGSRQAAIGGLIKKARIEAVMSVEELAQRAGLTPETLEAYELGNVAVPLPELELLSQALNSTLTNYESQEGVVGDWFTEQRSMKQFLGLPKEIQEFIGKPVNRPYLELAMKLSELKVERLRALAEGLLEITF